MSVDIATLGLEIRSDGVVTATDRLRQMNREAGNSETATNKLGSSFSNLAGYIKAAAAALGAYKLFDMAKDAALLAARYETLGVVMNTVGATAGYTNKQMADFQATLQKGGIAMVESRQVLTQMAQAHLDLSKASGLSRIAQDAAVIGGINSSQAFERMVSGIQRGEVEILKTIGINVNFEQSYERMAIQLNKSTTSLTETEKATARMNIVMEKGKDIAGVYESAMGTAGKQLTSVKRYADDLKVKLGGVFNDLLIVGVQAFTGGLKDANTEADKLAQDGKLQEMGRSLVLVVATLADGLMIVWHTGKTAMFTLVAGFEQVYYLVVAVAKALTFDFSGAKDAMTDFMQVGVSWAQAVSDEWKDATKFQDAAKKMFAERDANKGAEAEQKKKLEAMQMQAGELNKQNQLTTEQEILVKKNQQAWGKIVTSQLESNGEYVKSAQSAIELNKLTDEYKTLVDASAFSDKARAALAAQKVLDTNALLEAKRKELEFENQHAATMLNLNALKLQAQGISSEEVNLITQRARLALEEKTLQDQIATETNPKKRAQMEEMLAAQQSINSLVKEQGELELIIVKNKELSSKANEATKLALLNGNTELAKRLSLESTSAAYEARKAEFLKAHNTEAATQLDILYSQRNATAANMAKLQEYLGVQKGVTDELKKQEDFGGGKAAKFSDGTEMSASAKFNRNDPNDRTLADQIYSNMKAVMASGVDGGYSMSLWKQFQAEQGRLSELRNQQLLEEEQAANQKRFDLEAENAKKMQALAEENLKVSIQYLKEMTEAANKSISTALSQIRNIASSFDTLAKGLRSAAISLREAYNSNLIIPSGAVSPEQAYINAKEQLNSISAQAQSTGNAQLYNQIPELAKAVLDASKAYNASGSAYQTDYTWVQELLLQSAGKADTQATAAEQVVAALNKQEEILNAIKTALETGGDTASLLNQLNGATNAVNSSVSTLNSTTGGVTSAINTNGTSTDSKLNTLNSTTGGITGAVNTGLGSTGSVYSIMDSNYGRLDTLNTSITGVNTSVGGVTTATNNVKTATTNVETKINNSALYGTSGVASRSGQIQKVENRAVAGGNIANNMDATYKYYAKGGIANQASIFGEAGAEAAVPLPDGRTIPVTLSGGIQSADNRETIAELKAIIRTLQAGFTESIAVQKQTAKANDTIANKARLAAA